MTSETNPATPVLSQDALLESMNAALASLDEEKRSILTPEIVSEFLLMLYDSYFGDNPAQTEDKIHSFILEKIAEVGQ